MKNEALENVLIKLSAAGYSMKDVGVQCGVSRQQVLKTLTTWTGRDDGIPRDNAVKVLVFVSLKIGELVMPVIRHLPEVKGLEFKMKSRKFQQTHDKLAA